MPSVLRPGCEGHPVRVIQVEGGNLRPSLGDGRLESFGRQLFALANTSEHQQKAGRGTVGEPTLHYHEAEQAFFVLRRNEGHGKRLNEQLAERPWSPGR